MGSQCMVPYWKLWGPRVEMNFIWLSPLWNPSPFSLLFQREMREGASSWAREPFYTTTVNMWLLLLHMALWELM